jgi:uncharacterized protein (DUF305 family)
MKFAMEATATHELESPARFGAGIRIRDVLKWLLPLAAFGALAAGAALILGGDDHPGNDSADAGFARDMSRHHAQAVEMSLIVYRRTQDEEVALLAGDILTTQQAQIGMMMGWLDVWGLPVASDQPPMAWVGEDMTGMPGSKEGKSAGEEMGHDTAGGMPGIATDEEVASLKTLPPAKMDKEFLRLMIRHHQGGVAMAEEAVHLAKDDLVTGFAQQVIDSQQSEIKNMEGMLTAREEG